MKQLLVMVFILASAAATSAQQTFFDLVSDATTRPVQAAITKGADVDAQYHDGESVLMYAAGNNSNPGVVTLLLKAGADLNAKDDNGETVLMYAAENNDNPEVIATLLKAGADGNAQDQDGKTAFEYAQDNDALDSTDAYRQLQDASR